MEEEKIKQKIALDLSLRLIGKITIFFEKYDFMSKENFEEIRLSCVKEMGGEEY